MYVFYIETFVYTCSVLLFKCRKNRKSPADRPTGGKIHVIRIGFGPDFLGVKNDAKKGDNEGKLKVFVLGVGG